MEGGYYRQAPVIFISIGLTALGGSGLLKKLCPFVSAEGELLAVLDL
jgi:hypothetical protein